MIRHAGGAPPPAEPWAPPVHAARGRTVPGWCTLLLFSGGYAWMTPHVPGAGAFCAYVDRGLGRRPGLGTAGVTLLSYLLLTVSTTCYLSFQAGNLVAASTGIELPWWLISGVMLLIVGLLGHRKIDLSAKVLGVVLVFEIIAVFTIDVGVLASGRELSAPPRSPTPTG